MVITNGDTSYFTSTLSGVPSGLDLTNGDYQGWCADRSVYMPRGEQLTVQLTNLYDFTVQDESWNKINDVLNHPNGATRIELQNVIWYFLNQYSASLLTENEQLLIAAAHDDFVPQTGDWIGILAEPIQNTSNPWPFQVSFVQLRVPSQGSTEPTEPDDEPILPPTSVSHGFHYNDQAPNAITNGPYNGFAKETIEFSGAASFDPDGIIISYHWSFGDGATADTPLATHAYSHSGVYQVSLTVRDNFGLTDTETTEASIANRNSPPTTPSINGPANGTTTVDYSYTFHSIDRDGDLITYQINWGDGTSIQSETHPSGQYFSLHHHWSLPGTYKITVTASDGSLSVISEKNVVIKELPLAENIWILGLALLAIIALLALWLYARKGKNKQ